MDEGDAPYQSRFRSVAPLTPAPCMSGTAVSVMVSESAADESTLPPRDAKPVGERVASSALVITPDSRLGRRKRSPHAQGRDMSERFVGIDVSKETLDVHVLPEGRAFAVARTPAGIDGLLAELSGLGAELVVLEATGGLSRTKGVRSA